MNSPANSVVTFPTVTVDEVSPVVSLNADDGMFFEPEVDVEAAVVAGVDWVDEQAVRVPASARPAMASATVRPLRPAVRITVTDFMIVSPWS